MNALKVMNYVPGTGNPVFITDITYSTELANILGSALNSLGLTTYILSGFDDNGDGTYSPGIVWFFGKIYAYEGDSVPAGQYLFAGERQSDARSTIDGINYNAYTEYFLFCSTSNTSSNGVLVYPGTLNLDVIRVLKKAPIPDRTVDGIKIAEKGITNAEIADNTILESNMSDGSVSNRVLADNSVSTTKYQANSIPSVAFQDNSIADSRLQTISGFRILQQTIPGEWAIVNFSIVNNNMAAGSIDNRTLADSSVSYSKIDPSMKPMLQYRPFSVMIHVNLPINEGDNVIIDNISEPNILNFFPINKESDRHFIVSYQYEIFSMLTSVRNWKCSIYSAGLPNIIQSSSNSGGNTTNGVVYTDVFSVNPSSISFDSPVYITFEFEIPTFV